MCTSLLLFVLALLCFQACYTNAESFHLNHSVYKPELNATCQAAKHVYDVIYKSFDCFTVWLEMATVKGQPCTLYRYNNHRHDKIGIKEPMERAVFQYCNNTSKPADCYNCFNDAVDHIWFRNPCKVESHWEKVAKCMRTHNNPEFKWSRAFILKNLTKDVKISEKSYPYKLCGEHLANLGNYKTFKISFPLDMPRFRKEEEGEFNVLLSFFLNAFENNNPNGTTLSEKGFRCQDFVKGGYLSTYYHRLINSVLKENDEATVKAFETVRRDMCSKAANKEECVSCYSRGDQMFISYLMNYNGQVESVIEDFNTIFTTYKMCHNDSNVPSVYRHMLLSTHYELEDMDISNCGYIFKIYFNEMNRNPTYSKKTNLKDESYYKDQFQIIFNAVDFNLYSHLGYAFRHKKSGSCPVLIHNRISKLMRYTSHLWDRLKDVTTRNEMDDAIDLFSMMISI